MHEHLCINICKGLASCSRPGHIPLRTQERIILRRGVSAVVCRCFLQIRGPKGNFFDAKTEPKKVPKTSRVDPKGNHNEQHNLQRHPCGTESKRVAKRSPRRWLLDTIFDQNSIQINKNTMPENIQKSATEKQDKWWQNDAKSEPEIIEFSICWRKDEFRQLLLLRQ